MTTPQLQNRVAKLQERIAEVRERLVAKRLAQPMTDDERTVIAEWRADPTCGGLFAPRNVTEDDIPLMRRLLAEIEFGMDADWPPPKPEDFASVDAYKAFMRLAEKG